MRLPESHSPPLAGRHISPFSFIHYPPDKRPTRGNATARIIKHISPFLLFSNPAWPSSFFSIHHRYHYSHLTLRLCLRVEPRHHASSLSTPVTFQSLSPFRGRSPPTSYFSTSLLGSRQPSSPLVTDIVPPRFKLRPLGALTSSGSSQSREESRWTRNPNGQTSSHPAIRTWSLSIAYPLALAHPHSTAVATSLLRTVQECSRLSLKHRRHTPWTVLAPLHIATTIRPQSLPLALFNILQSSDPFLPARTTSYRSLLN